MINSVLKYVFDQRNQQHRWNLNFIYDSLLPEIFINRISEPEVFQMDVMMDEFNFTGKRNPGFRALLNKISHDSAEFLKQVGRLRGFPPGNVINIIQGIEKKMRVHLRLQEIVLRFCVLSEQLLLLSPDLKIVQGEPENDAVYKYYAMGNECVVVVPGLQNMRTAVDQIIPDIILRIYAQNGYNQQQQDNANCKDPVFFSSVKPGNQVQRAGINNNSVGGRRIKCVIERI